MPFRIEEAAPGRRKASGQLGFETAAEALRAGLAHIGNGRPWTIDLSGVTSGDSAGIAEMVEWLSVATALGAVLAFEAVPAQMLAIARISGLEDLILGQSGC
jgi:phospholipid transport system transporter-binding protein